MTVVLDALAEGARMTAAMAWETLWPLVLGFTLSGAVQAFVSRDRMQAALGDAGPRAVGLATLFGIASSSCSYAASALARTLFRRGADFTTAVIFMVASTNLVVELGLVLWALMGWQFAAAEYAGGAVMIALLAVGGRFAFPARAVAAAREAAGAGAGSEQDGMRAARPGILTVAGWTDAAGYTIADLGMLRRELVAGYLVAGYAAALVPAAAWDVLFLRGHGTLTLLENVVVGPLIAILSFVCSIGNVPLAAALWSGGMSFGGVVSFVFADLITLPLLLIYRRYYGLAMTLRMLAVLWIVMSGAGLAVDLVFGAAGAVPATHSAVAGLAGPGWNLTTALNAVALAVFAAQLWLHRNRSRLGTSGRYAIDPVCGMQVERAHAAAVAELEGATWFFCSEGCRDSFVRQRSRPAPSGRALPVLGGGRRPPG